jgi:hypothetical protein
MVLFMNTIPLYWICPTCGASLDPGEKCDTCHPIVGVPMFPGTNNVANYQAVTPTINNNTYGGGDNGICRITQVRHS